jgi:hypothetical protein
VDGWERAVSDAVCGLLAWAGRERRMALAAMAWPPVGADAHRCALGLEDLPHPEADTALAPALAVVLACIVCRAEQLRAALILGGGLD